MSTFAIRTLSSSQAFSSCCSTFLKSSTCWPSSSGCSRRSSQGPGLLPAQLWHHTQWALSGGVQQGRAPHPPAAGQRRRGTRGRLQRLQVLARHRALPACWGRTGKVHSLRKGKRPSREPTAKDAGCTALRWPRARTKMPRALPWSVCPELVPGRWASSMPSECRQYPHNRLWRLRSRMPAELPRLLPEGLLRPPRTAAGTVAGTVARTASGTESGIAQHTELRSQPAAQQRTTFPTVSRFSVTCTGSQGSRTLIRSGR
mmetsp:Transcript_31747/g.72210  ORF Transcript_31747/g.72210 Transcript_31747/m.72210 type:complete len:259 (-) Transcript_31747:11-787(-)